MSTEVHTASYTETIAYELLADMMFYDKLNVVSYRMRCVVDVPKSLCPCDNCIGDYLATVLPRTHAQYFFARNNTSYIRLHLNFYKL